MSPAGMADQDRDLSSGERMVLIPGSWFAMGTSVPPMETVSELPEARGTRGTQGSRGTRNPCDGGRHDEHPVHRVWVDAFELAATQVTNVQYEAFLNETHHLPPPFWKQRGFDDPLQPVVAVSWFDALAFCEWRSRNGGRVYRLPSEAEWERAARGTREQALYPWGDDPPQTRPRYEERWRTGPEVVAGDAPNELGLYDLCTNVHEWCSDWYDAGYYARSDERNPRGPETGTRRASRGGSWRHQVKISRCAARSSLPPGAHYADYGFRIARDL